jgi:XTP/dITP diphosphohydrolase
VSRRLIEARLVLATHNPGKLRELQALLEPRGIEVVSAAELRLPEPVEDGRTFEDNARIKARAAAGAAGLPALADDSGLAAMGLDGAPGVHSARWAEPGKDFGAAMARVRDELAMRFGSFATADRRAAFVAALCLAWPDRHEELTQGRVDGHLVDPPRGNGGFGYDPMFVPEGRSETFAEMAPEAKQALSHRGRALRELLERCFPPPR